MFDIGLQEMLVIGVLALLVFGPSKLPELGRMVGRALREFRRASDEFRSTVETNLHMHEPDPLPVSSEPPPAAAVDETSSTLSAADTLPSEAEPAFVESGSPAVAVADTGDPFCAARSSKIFHRRDCRWARRLPESERRSFTSVKEARDEGFAACPVCEPPESSETS